MATESPFFTPTERSQLDTRHTSFSTCALRGKGRAETRCCGSGGSEARQGWRRRSLVKIGAVAGGARLGTQGQKVRLRAACRRRWRRCESETRQIGAPVGCQRLHRHPAARDGAQQRHGEGRALHGSRALTE